jgi:hypothetical protein
VLRDELDAAVPRPIVGSGRMFALRCVGTKADDHRDVLNIPSLTERSDADDCVDQVVASFVKLLA